MYTEILESLKTFLDTNVVPEPEWGEGVAAAAVLGIGVLFDQIPLKFPVPDIMVWIKNQIDPNLPACVYEKALIKLANSFFGVNHERI